MKYLPLSLSLSLPLSHTHTYVLELLHDRMQSVRLLIDVNTISQLEDVIDGQTDRTCL
jgi:hypothetical protein